MSVLSVEKVTAGYAAADEVLKGVDLHIEEREIVTIIGPNGAGKSTLLKTIAGLLRPKAGSIRFQGAEVSALPPRDLTARGIAYVPQERNVFPSLTIGENLEMAAYLTPTSVPAKLQSVLTRFPDIAVKRRQQARTLSGGQRQILALAMALMADPVLMLLDEPSAGMSPRATEMMFKAVQEIRDGGVAIAMVEQNAFASLSVANRAYILVDGRNSRDGVASTLRDDPDIRRIFLGA